MYPRLEIGPIVIGTYGLALFVAFLISWKVLEVNLTRHKLPGGRADWIILSLSVAGILGSKVYHVLETPAELFAHPSTLFAFTGGFAWFGGFLAGVATLWLLALYYKMPVLELLDLASPVAALGYAIGRLGCFFSGDGDYGRPTSLSWGMRFPNGTVPTFVPVHPTPIYEFIINLGIFYYLWSAGGKHTQRGGILAQYLVLSGVSRFLVEFIRLNPPLVAGLTNAQVVSLLCILAGVALLFRPSGVTHKTAESKRNEHRVPNPR